MNDFVHWVFNDPLARLALMMCLTVPGFWVITTLAEIMPKTETQKLQDELSATYGKTRDGGFVLVPKELLGEVLDTASVEDGCSCRDSDRESYRKERDKIDHLRRIAGIPVE